MERMSAPYLTLMTEDAPVLATLGYPFQKRTSTMALVLATWHICSQNLFFSKNGCAK